MSINRERTIALPDSRYYPANPAAPIASAWRSAKTLPRTSNRCRPPLLATVLTSARSLLRFAPHRSAPRRAARLVASYPCDARRILRLVRDDGRRRCTPASFLLHLHRAVSTGSPREEGAYRRDEARSAWNRPAVSRERERERVRKCVREKESALPVSHVISMSRCVLAIALGRQNEQANPSPHQRCVTIGCPGPATRSAFLPARQNSAFHARTRGITAVPFPRYNPILGFRARGVTSPAVAAPE